MVHALFPGSFDPVTSGHVDLVERGLALFDEVTVAVAANSQKQPLFSMEERMALLKSVLPSEVKVTSFTGLVVDHCVAHGHQVILRGLRTVVDFEFEYQMALTNRHMQPKVETAFLLPSVQFSYISSSLIKDIVRNGGDVSAFVPAAVEAELRARLGVSD